MDPIKELVDETTLQRAMLALVVVGPLAGGVLGMVLAAAKRQSVRLGLGRGLVGGLLGPLAWLLWRLFEWLTRFQPAADPQHDYFGLERVDVLLLNIVIFVAVGAGVGLLVRRVRARDAQRAGVVAKASESLADEVG
jgi:hypothetical protein